MPCSRSVGSSGTWEPAPDATVFCLEVLTTSSAVCLFSCTVEEIGDIPALNSDLIRGDMAGILTTITKNLWRKVKK